LERPSQLTASSMIVFASTCSKLADFNHAAMHTFVLWEQSACLCSPLAATDDCILLTHTVGPRFLEHNVRV
jgi:hypothetical protein